MKKLFFLLLLITSPVFAAADFLSTANEILGNPDTCLELKYDLNNGSNRTEYIYINNNDKRVTFSNKTAVEVLQYNDSIIKFKTIKNDENEKGYIFEAVYEINRYTGGCTVNIYHKAVGFKEKFNNSFYGFQQSYLVKSGTGLVKKVDSSIQKF